MHHNSPQHEAITRVHLGGQVLTFGAQRQNTDVHWAAPLGFQTLADEVLLANGALALGVEVGIQRTEDALMKMGMSTGTGTGIGKSLGIDMDMDWHVHSSQSLPNPSSTCALTVEGNLNPIQRELDAAQGVMDIELIERIFNQWLSLLLGAQGQSTFLESHLDFFAKLLILRETMHHVHIPRFIYVPLCI